MIENMQSTGLCILLSQDYVSQYVSRAKGLASFLNCLSNMGAPCHVMMVMWEVHDFHGLHATISSWWKRSRS